MRGKVPGRSGSQTERPGNETERSGSNKDNLFWDAVVISAGDESQQAWYEAQLELKKESGSLPLVRMGRQGNCSGGMSGIEWI